MNFNFKKILYLSIISLSCVVIFNLTSFAAVIENIEFDRDAQEIIVTGQLPIRKANLFITFEVLKPGKQLGDLLSATPDTLKEVISDFQQTVTDVNGNYVIKYSIAGDAGKYKARVGWKNISNPEEMEFVYFTPSQIQTAMTEINNANDIGSIQIAFEKNKDILGLDFSQYQLLTDKQLVANRVFDFRNKLVNKSFTTVKELINVFSEALFIEMINEAQSSNQVADLLILNGNIINIDKDSLYEVYSNKLDADGKNAVMRAIADRSDFETVDQLRNIFFEQVIIQGIYKINDWRDIKEFLTLVNGNLKLDFSLYSLLNDTYDVDKKLAGYLFSNTVEIRNAFIQAVDDSINKQKNSANSTGSAVSGTGKSAIISNSPLLVDDRKNIFTDLNNVGWAVDSITELLKKGVISESIDGLFRPEDHVTREEFVKMLIAAFELLDETATSRFFDVTDNAWYYKYIASAEKLGIVNGMKDNYFGVGNEITRQEMATIAYRVAKYAEIELKSISPMTVFVDASDIQSYATESISAMQQVGIINGMGGNRFAPNEYSTRAQAAKIVFNLLKLR